MYNFPYIIEAISKPNPKGLPADGCFTQRQDASEFLSSFFMQQFPRGPLGLHHDEVDMLLDKQGPIVCGEGLAIDSFDRDRAVRAANDSCLQVETLNRLLIRDIIIECYAGIDLRVCEILDAAHILEDRIFPPSIHTKATVCSRLLPGYEGRILVRWAAVHGKYAPNRTFWEKRKFR